MTRSAALSSASMPRRSTRPSGRVGSVMVRLQCGIVAKNLAQPFARVAQVPSRHRLRNIQPRRDLRMSPSLEIVQQHDLPLDVAELRERALQALAQLAMQDPRI